MSAPLFTVFTPTYNRAHTLGRVYQSLLSQTFIDFEWLIVDDGSGDGTDELVSGFMAEKKIVIRYLQQPNGGKHVAFNRGVREARGELFLPFDSDDSCVPVALENFRAHWLSIPESLREEFSGITCLCKNERGESIGGELPSVFLDGHPYEVVSRYRLVGEKWGFHLTRILKEYPFPEFQGERFVPEGLIWNRIGTSYKIRFINEALRIYYDSTDGLSASSLKIRLSSPCATFIYYYEAMALPIRIIDRFKAAVNLWRFTWHSKNWSKIISIRKNRELLYTALLPGFFLAVRDRMRGK